MQDRSASTPGFTVRLEGASLFDLIQFECMDRERKVLRVNAQGRVGTLFFREGNLVHAIAGDLVGEHAVRAILGWRDGQVVHTTGSWPAHESISTTWQSVLLHAATAQDEVSRVDNVLSFPARDVPEAEDAMARNPPFLESPVHTARITASGDVRAAAPDRDHAETFAYLAELADVIGDGLAIDRMTSIEIWSSEVNGIVLRDVVTGEISAAWGARHVDSATLREELESGDF